MDADQVCRLLQKIRRQVESGRGNGPGAPKIDPDDYAALLGYFCRRYAARFHDFADQADYKTSDGRLRCSATVVCWFNDALMKINDTVKTQIHDYKRMDALFATIMNRCMTGWFRSRNDDSFAAPLHRYLSAENDHVALHEKGRSIMADWWKGARWQDDPAIRKYTGASLYGDFPVRPFWQATEAADVVRRCDISEGEIVRRYTLYLLELKQRKYLVHRMVLDVLSAEFETLKIVVEPKGGSPAESEDEDGETWWLRDRGDDPVGLRDCVSAMLAHVKGVRERLVLYLYACGYGYEEMPELIAAYMGRHAGAEGTNRVKTTGKSTANAVFNAKIRPLLHEHGLEGREGLDLIAETLDIEFGHSRDTMEK